jgi:thiol-disulfide isomerase/thioredoxin
MFMNLKKIFTLILLSLGFAVVVFLVTRQEEENPSPVVEEENSDLQAVNADQLKALIQGLDSKVIVVNFWATFCGPCREEFPYFVSLYREFKDQGMSLLFVSMDFDSDRPQIDEFLSEQGVNFVTYLRAGKDDEFIRGVHPEWSGVLPMTLVYDSSKQLAKFLPKAMTYEELEDVITGVLSSSGRSQPNKDQGESK